VTDRILIVEDDLAMRELLRDDLQDRGYETDEAASVAAALEILDPQIHDAIVTDLNLGVADGLDLTRAALARDPGLPVVVITAFGTMEAAIRAIRQGAYDFLTKPLSLPDLALTLERAVALRALRHEVAQLRSQTAERSGRISLGGNCAAIRRLSERIELVAPTMANVMLLGESGVGKTRAARLIHTLSGRKGPFVAVNMGSIPQHLVESELFGHVEGAFTGAGDAREGLMLRAEGGTLLLDEIGETPPNLQPTLLQALDERRVRPVGSDSTVPIDVRVIAATNRDLDADVQSGRFRADLFFRLAVMELHVPPLRDRGRDILELAQRFVCEASESFGKPVQGLQPDAALALITYHWPGNIRELRNCMEQAVIVTRRRLICRADLPERLTKEHDDRPPSGDSTELRCLADVERRHILAVLRHVHGRRSEAAHILGIGRKTLYRKLQAWGIDTDSMRRGSG